MSERRTLVNKPLILHSDNGSPMKGASLLETLYQLGITPSRSRPRVSNDNPYAESFLTPNQRHNGLSTQILERRKQVYEEAKLKHPERWSGSIRDWTLDDIVWLNPERTEQSKTKEKCTS